jgi:hypothetical protein
MSILPVSNIINVTIADTPSGLAERNVNSLMLFTNETPGNLDPYGIYLSPAQVKEDYGTSSVTAQMANAIFSQTPNLRSGNGRLIIAPMLAAVSATEGQIVTADLTSTLAAIILVSNGDLKVTINGVAYNLTGLNFTGCTTYADIATVLQQALKEGVVTATVNGFQIVSKKVGSTSTVALAAVSGGTGTDLAAVGYFKASTATATAGANSSGETLLQAIARLESQVSFAGVMSNLDLEDAAVLVVSNGVQAQDRLYFQHFASIADIAGIITTIKNAGNRHTRCLLYSIDQASANLEKAAYAGRGLSVNFNGSNTSQTMNLKQLATITPDPNISQTNYTNADTAGADLYVSYDGVPSVFSTGGNDFFDNPYSDLALKFALETAGFNYLRQTNTKVPQTESGMYGLKNAYAQVCERFIRNGCIAAGSWTSSETFGDPEIFKQNILDRGYYIYSLPIVQQDAAEREDRKAPLVQIAIKRAGAIHTSDVIVIIND